MLERLIVGFPDELERIREVATRGFIMAFDLTWKGPRHLHSEYPQAWRDMYEARNFYPTDPVLIHAVTSRESRRWSEVRLPDIRKVMVAARAFNLNYGVVVPAITEGGRSFFTAAREDREFTDGEITLLAERFERMNGQVLQSHDLDKAELDVLRLLTQGLRNKEIARELSVSESTVKQRCARICQALRSKTLSQAVASAVSRSLI